ncbi:MAG: hypothetical protein WCB55_17165, partial [Pseudolabrys sp.]
TFVMAKGGGSEIGTTKRGKGMKIMAIVDRHGLPLAVSTDAANHHEVPSDSSRRPMHQIQRHAGRRKEDGRAYDATHVRTASRLISDGKV